MPGFHIHVAIGNNYKKKNNLLNSFLFDKGIVYPDLEKNKGMSHYSGHQDKNNLIDYLENKVNLAEFLRQNDISDDYNKGVFLHLVTDYLFFNYFISKDYLKKIDYDGFCKDLYYSYDMSNLYLVKKYELDFPVLKDEILEAIKLSKVEKYVDNRTYFNLLPTDKLDCFIATVSNIDLDKYASKIVKIGKNCLPDELI